MIQKQINKTQPATRTLLAGKSGELDSPVQMLVNSKSNLRVLGKKGGSKTAPLMLYRSVGQSGSFMAPDLKPLCKCEVSSTLALFNVFASLGQGTFTYVADPTGNATNSLSVFQWSTRFVGFQQYRIVKTAWHITPLRTIELFSSSIGTIGGYAIVWIEDSPQSGAPSQAVALASLPRARVLFNSETLHTVHYSTNEPGDLNLSDINTSPTHLTGSTVSLGQHCLQIYTDDGFFGLTNLPSSPATVPVLGVQAVYTIEFFGIGGN